MSDSARPLLSAKPQRRTPKQRRSREIVAALVESARQLLSEPDRERLTTNRVAERAGVSIGSLYRYFRNKDDLVAAVLTSDSEVEAHHLDQSDWEIDRLPLADAVEALVDFQLERHRRLLDRFGRFHREHHRVTSLARRIGIREVEQRLRWQLDRHADEIAVRDLDQAAFMLSRGVSAIVRVALEERPEKLDEPEFRSALVDLIQCYLGTDRPGSVGPSGDEIASVGPVAAE